MMMARLELWTLVILWFTLGDFGAVLGKDEASVKKESHRVLFRHKREWQWNSLYVEEEKPAPIPYKIGQLKSTVKIEVKNFRIEGEGANTIFTVDNNGDLFVTRSLDREEKSVYHLSATMYDGNNKLVEGSGSFEVVVNDINDNIPVFPKGLNVSVAERATIGTEILQVKATDADDPSTANGDLRYSLVRGGEGKFQIDQVTGMLSCRRGDLDRESVPQYVLVVQAQDMRGLPSGSTATTSVTVSITDINDNIASFTTNNFEVSVPENHKLNQKITTLQLHDRDERRHKNPQFFITGGYSTMFEMKPDQEKDGSLILKQPLDYETLSEHKFTVEVRELLAVRSPENSHTAITTATVTIRVTDVDEPPVFSPPSYNFTVLEETIVQNIGTISATDPDKARNIVRYSIMDQDSPFSINPRTGVLSTVRPLDRELEATHMFQVKAREEGSGLESFVKVDINVQDINDNKPELIAEEIYLCENDRASTVLGVLRATDKDDHPSRFTFSLASPSSNFTVRDHGNNTADVLLKQGPFSLDESRDYIVAVRVGDGGRPQQLTSVTQVHIKACHCDHGRVQTHCKAAARRMGVSVHALIAILLCILTILESGEHYQRPHSPSTQTVLPTTVRKARLQHAVPH